MNFNRRQFFEVSGKGTLGTAMLLSTAGSSAFLLSGCSVWTDIENWIPVGEAALNSILSVLSANGVALAPAIQTVVGLIEAGFTALLAAIKEYQSVTPAPVGALAKVHEAFQAIVDNFTTFLEALKVSSPLLSIIVGLAQIVFSTIAAFVNQIPPAPAPAASLKMHAVSVGGIPVSVAAKSRTRRAFKKDWNSSLDTGVKQGVKVPKAAYLPVTFWEHL